jgi:hypothetical protein
VLVPPPRRVTARNLHHGRRHTFTALAAVASNDLTVRRNKGGCATVAVSMPGNFTSMV